MFASLANVSKFGASVWRYVALCRQVLALCVLLCVWRKSVFALLIYVAMALCVWRKCVAQVCGAMCGKCVLASSVWRYACLAPLAP
jgi:hypothetical protein